MGLDGQISGIGIPELLQVAAMSAGHCLLEVQAGDVTAWIAFETGTIVRFGRSDLELTDEETEAEERARDAARAEEALLDVSTWKEGRFSLRCAEEPLPWDGPKGIEFDVPIRPESVALGAACRQDEERRRAEGMTGPRAARPSEAPAGPPPSAVVIVDPDADLLEALKSGMSALDVRVHVFQSSEEAWFRVQQYLVRGEAPALVLGSAVPDPVEPGFRPGWRRFAARLQAIAPAARVLLIHSGDPPSTPLLHAALSRPQDPRPDAPETRDLVAGIGAALGLHA